MNKIPVYFMPGMCSNSIIFERIKLNEEHFETIYLEWLPIDKHDNLNTYVNRIAQLITHENPVLIGVSFGGIIMQEISTLISVRKTIIISSARSNEEYPPIYNFARKTSLYKLLPTGHISQLIKYFVQLTERSDKSRLEMYDRYITIRDKKYIDWCIKEILNWKPTEAFKNTIHIQGTKDEFFPIKYTKHAILIPNGTHAMIITKYKWFNENLEKIILT